MRQLLTRMSINSERRTSTYRRSTMGGQQPTTPSGGPSSLPLSRPKQDPRDARSSQTRSQWAAEIVAFLNSRGHSVEIKQLLTPTGAQFQSIFKTLIGALIDNYQFGGQGKKFEDEVIPALRTVLYPFADSITKSHLQAVGSQASWPNMLAMLHWLVTVAQVRLTVRNVLRADKETSIASLHSRMTQNLECRIRTRRSPTPRNMPGSTLSRALTRNSSHLRTLIRPQSLNFSTGA